MSFGSLQDQKILVTWALHLEHRNRGAARAPLVQQRYTPLAARTGHRPPPSLAPSARTHAAAARALSTAPTPDIARVATRTPAAAAAAAATGQHHAHARRIARRTHRARSHSTAAGSRAAEIQTPRTNDDARRRKDAACPHGHKAGLPETPIDGVRKHWASAPATGSPPFSSHASVAHTATRPSSQGPTSALRLNYHRMFASTVWRFRTPARGAAASLQRCNDPKFTASY